MKECRECKNPKPISDFYQKSLDCKLCFNDKGRERMRIRRADFRKKLIEIKESNPCMDCGIQYPHHTMEYDHINKDKLMNVTHMLTGSRSWASIEREIAKCELVCANCHRARTFKRRENDGD